jgi:hypothetical protein
VRGQVTIFFALGLVLLIAIGILYLMLSRADDTQAPQVIDIAANPALNSYVTSCLDTVVNDELEEIGDTGGLSLLSAADQAQYPNGQVMMDGEPAHVLYGITQNHRKAPELEPTSVIPEETGVDLVRAEDRNIDFAHMTMYCRSGHQLPEGEPFCFALPGFLPGYFGELNFLALCARDGPNGAGTSVLCTSYPGMPPGLQPVSQRSVQGLLTDRVQERVVSCVSEQRFRETIGQGFTVTAPPKVNIMFTRTNILVGLVYKCTTSRSRAAREAQSRILIAVILCASCRCCNSQAASRLRTRGTLLSTCPRITLIASGSRMRKGSG